MKEWEESDILNELVKTKTIHGYVDDNSNNNNFRYLLIVARNHPDGYQFVYFLNASYEHLKELFDSIQIVLDDGINNKNDVLVNTSSSDEDDDCSLDVGKAIFDTAMSDNSLMNIEGSTACQAAIIQKYAEMQVAVSRARVTNELASNHSDTSVDTNAAETGEQTRNDAVATSVVAAELPSNHTDTTMVTNAAETGEQTRNDAAATAVPSNHTDTTVVTNAAETNEQTRNDAVATAVVAAELPRNHTDTTVVTNAAETNEQTRNDSVATAVVAAGIGSVVTTGGTSLVAGAMGYTSAGIAANSMAAAIMSAEAIAAGGGVAAGGFTATMQTIGVVGALASPVAIPLAAGGAILGYGSYYLFQRLKSRANAREEQQ